MANRDRRTGTNVPGDEKEDLGHLPVGPPDDGGTVGRNPADGGTDGRSEGGGEPAAGDNHLRKGGPDEHWNVAQEVFLAVRDPYALPDEPAREEFPRLLRFLTDRQTPAGKSLEVPRLTLEATPEGWKATVQHYTLSLKFTRNFDYLHEIWAELEKAFNSRRGWMATKTGEAAKRRQAEETSNLTKHPDELYNLAKGGGDPKKRKQ